MRFWRRMSCRTEFGVRSSGFGVRFSVFGFDFSQFVAWYSDSEIGVRLDEPVLRRRTIVQNRSAQRLIVDAIDPNGQPQIGFPIFT